MGKRLIKVLKLVVLVLEDSFAVFFDVLCYLLSCFCVVFGTQQETNH